MKALRLMLTSKEPGPGGMRLFPSELNLSFGKRLMNACLMLMKGY